MTEVLIAAIALVPSLLTYLNGRRRQLADIKAEVDLLAVMPDDLEESRKQVAAQIDRSVRLYSERRQRTFDQFFTWAPAVTTGVFFVAFTVYQGNVTDPDTLRQFRRLLAASAMGLSGGAFLVWLGVVAVRGYLLGKIGWLRFKIFRKERLIRGRERYVTGLEETTELLEHEVRQMVDHAASEVARTKAAIQTIQARHEPVPEEYSTYLDYWQHRYDGGVEVLKQRPISPSGLSEPAELPAPPDPSRPPPRPARAKSLSRRARSLRR